MTPHGQTGHKVIKWSGLNTSGQCSSVMYVFHQEAKWTKSSLTKAGCGAVVLMVTYAIFFSGKTIPPVFLIIDFFSEFVNLI